MIDENGLSDPNNLQLRISWNPLQVEDGREFLLGYVVKIDIFNLSSTNHPKRQDNSFSDTLPPHVSTYTYEEARPFTEYNVQVLASLIVDEIITHQPVTGIKTIITPESGETKGVTWPFLLSLLWMIIGTFLFHESALTYSFMFSKELAQIEIRTPNQNCF